MFIHILNLTHPHLKVAIGSEFALLAVGPTVLPWLPCGTEAELWKTWKDSQIPSPSSVHHI
jgi:hypothetical protein